MSRLKSSTAHRLVKNTLKFSLEAQENKIQVVNVFWNINQVRIIMNPENFNKTRPWEHAIQMSPTTSTEETQQRVKMITGWPSKAPLHSLFNSVVMKMIFWNCRGAGNSNFKDSMKNLYRDHDPDVMVLFETKIRLQSLGNFFVQFGLSEATFTDPVGGI